MPQRRQNSMVRTPTRSILGWLIAPSLFSINTHGMPRQPRSPASARPTGPAPTMSTGGFIARLVVHLRAGLLDDFRPFRDLGADVRRRLLGRVADRLRAELVEA